jgi:hypothetical protein
LSALAADAPQCFPASIDGLTADLYSDAKRAELATYRNTVAAGYDADVYDFAATTYLYDRAPNPSLDDEYALVWQAVKQAHPQVEIVRSALTTLPSTHAKGMLGLGTYSEGDVDFATIVWLAEGDTQFLKVRATYVRPEDDAKTAGAMRFAFESLEKIVGASCTPP